MTSLAAKVTGLRGAKGLTSKQLADRVHMQRSYLSRIESSKNDNIGRKILQGLAKELDCRIDYLTDDSISETRSWNKVAIDESLDLFVRTNNLSEEEKNGLKRISFRENAPRTLKDWEYTWDHIKTYFRPKRSRQPSNKRPRTHKDANSEGFPTDFPTSNMGLS